jgi:hypothetical protein
MRQNEFLLGALQEIIRKETMFLRHYYGKVTGNVDSLKKGRVQVVIEQLAIIPPNFLWCSPRQNNSLTVPNINDYVEVYFMYGRGEYAVYLYPAAEMANMANKAATPDPFQDIIYSSPQSGADAITYHRTTGIMKILSWFTLSKATPKIKMLDGNEPFILGNQLETFLKTLVTSTYNTHVHIVTDPVSGPLTSGPPNPTGSDPSGIKSTEIMGK